MMAHTWLSRGLSSPWDTHKRIQCRRMPTLGGERPENFLALIPDSFSYHVNESQFGSKRHIKHYNSLYSF